jgi:hypothetical protein
LGLGGWGWEFKLQGSGSNLKTAKAVWGVGFRVVKGAGFRVQG